MFFKRERKSKKIVIFDFRSSSVAGSVLAINPKHSQPTILFAKREYYFFTEKPSPNEFINRAHIAFKKLINEINHFSTPDSEIENEIDSVKILLGEPWYTPNFVEVHYDQNKEFTVSANLLSKITQNLVKENKIEEDLEIIEKNIASILINGYESESPIGKKAKDLKISFCITKIAKETKENLSDIIRKSFNNNNIEFYSHTNVIYSFLKNNFHSMKDYLIFDISGEITEMTLVRKTLLKTHASIPVGIHIFTRKISEYLGLGLYNTWSSLNLFADKKHVEQNKQKRVYNLIEKVSDEFFPHIKNILEKNNITNLPNKIFLITDEESRVLMKNLFENHDVYYDILKLPRKPDIISFNKRSFDNFCNYEIGVKNDNIISIFANFVKMYDSID